MLRLPRDIETSFDDRVGCSHAAILHVLRWYGVEHLELVFGPAPEVCFNPSSGEIEFWPPPWEPVSRERYGVYFQEKNFGAFDAGWRQVLGRLEAGHPTVVVADGFHLPFYSAYHTNHTGHCVIISGYDPQARKVHIADISAMLWKGPVDLDEMQLALDLAVLPKGQVKLRYFDIRPPAVTPEYRRDELVRVILPRAAQGMRGGPPGAAEHLITGLKGVKAYAAYIPTLGQRFLEAGAYGKTFIASHRLGDLSVAERRMWFSEILRKARELLGLNALAAPYETFLELEEQWRIAANLYIKAAVADPAVMFPRIQRRVEGLIALEAQAAAELEEAAACA